MQHRAHILSQCALMNIAAIPTTFAPSLLPDLALIRLQGADAAAFIHNQLSHDFLLLKPEEARLAVWCTPKGRALVSFYGFKPQADTVYLLLAADSVEFIVKRLKMFVLRSKCTVEDVSAQWRISGHIEKIESGAKALAMHTRAGAEGYVVALPSVEIDSQAFSREIRVEAASEASKIEVNTDSLLWWNWLQVQSGVALVGAALREAFVPQMINYESLGGINFKKGCYPGQEVVARSQFRGAIKRRAFVAHVAGVAEAGQEVFDASAPDQPVGLIAQTAPAPGGGTAVIVSLQLSAEHAADLRVGAADGPRLAGLQLPFALLADV